MKTIRCLTAAEEERGGDLLAEITNEKKRTREREREREETPDLPTTKRVLGSLRRSGGATYGTTTAPSGRKRPPFGKANSHRTVEMSV